MEPMDEGDDVELEICAACGADIAEETTAYGISDEEWLCLDCAVARGGELDELRERWIVAPDLEGLAHGEA